MPQFDLSSFPGQILWLAAIFALQYLIIARYVVPGFKVLFDKRRRYIEQQLVETDMFRSKSEALKAEYEQKLDYIKKKHSEALNEAYQKTELISETELEKLDKIFAKEVKQREEKAKVSQKAVATSIDSATLDLASNLLLKVMNGKVTKQQLSKYMN